jgi:hypothetical protein
MIMLAPDVAPNNKDTEKKNNKKKSFRWPSVPPLPEAEAEAEVQSRNAAW